MAEQPMNIALDQRAVMMLASILRKGSVKQTHTVKRIANYTRITTVGKFGKRTNKKGDVEENAFLGFEKKEEKYPEAYEVTLPARSPNDEPNTLVLTPDEMAHFKLSLDGGLVDTETGEKLFEGNNIITLPLAKSVA